MILIDEPMPTGCAECFFSTGCNACNGFIDTCTLTGKQFKLKDYSTVYPDPRPDWCPLIEMILCKDCKHGSIYMTEDVCGETLIECNRPDLGDVIEIHGWKWFCADGERKS